jgi:hypothetical protein
LPSKSPWLNPIEPKWVHGKRAVSEPDRLLSADELEARVVLTITVGVKHIWSGQKRSLDYALGPHFVELRVQPTMPLKLVCTAYLYLYLLSRDIGQHSLIHLVQLRRLFLSSLMTVVGLTCSMRAVSRIPLAFIAISTI